VYGVAAIGEEAPKPGTWDTSATAGINLTRGNSRTLLANGRILTERKWDQNEVRFGADANYGENEITTTNNTKKMETNVQNARVFAEYRRLLTDRLFAYLNGELLTDDIADIDYRLTVGPGLGYYFIKTDQATLSGEIGTAYIREKIEGTTDDRMVLRVAERGEAKISPTAKVWESVEYLPAFEDFGLYLLNSEIGVEAIMTSRMSLTLSAQDKYNSQPAPGRDQNDIMVVGGVTWKL
jgi:putative salt-induced outer membrane protein